MVNFSLNYAALAALLFLMGGASAENLNITSPPITDWGNWGILENCPNGTYAQGFQLKTEHNQYLGDDTALNAIKLFCGDPNRPNEPTIMSTEGDFGQWGKVFTCYPGVLNGFQLRVESERGPNGDNTATNNIRFFCSTRDPDDYIQGDGMAWGTWGISRHCYRDQGICGIMTQVQPYQGSDDDTALNNVLMECCDREGHAALKIEKL